MKKVLFALLLAVASVPAFATDATVTVEASSDFLYRGQSVTNDKPAVTAGLRLDGLVGDGVFATAQGTTLDLGNLDQDGTIRSEFAVGYGHRFGDLSLNGSVARVLNPVTKSDDYTEARVDAAYALTDDFSVYGQYAQVLTDAVGQDRYAAVGVQWDNFVVDKLSVGLLASAQQYKKADRTEFNNAEVYGSYAFNKHLTAFGSYSWGGTSVLNALDATDVSFNASDLSDQGQVGIRYTF